MDDTTSACPICDRPVSEADSHIALAKSGLDPILVHEGCVTALKSQRSD
jgi:hypothetical protein